MTHPRHLRKGLWLLAVLSATWAGMVDAEATAGAIVANPVGTGEVHTCSCGMGCRTSCCCATTKPAPTRRPRMDRGPCLTSAPCGEPAGTSSPAPRVRTLAWPWLRPPLRWESAGSLLEADPSALSPAILAARIDHPPEGAAHA
jgi:hypothetical protein